MATVEIKDKNGKTIKKFTKPCNSYLRQMIDMLYIQMGSTSGSLKDTGGSARSVAASIYAFRVNTEVGNAAWGIQVGTGTGAVTISDFQLNPLIAAGNDPDQLNYGEMSVGIPAIVGSSAKFTLARTFTNNSGSDITVKEVGLVTFGASYAFMLERTLLEFTIANAQSGTVTYTISVTV